METRAFLLLCAAHCLADFALQPDWLARGKHRVLRMLLHGLIHAATAYLVFQAWGYWQLPVAVLLTHLLIDTVKALGPDTAKAFAVDQVAHGLSLAGLVWILRRFENLPAFTGIGFPWIITLGGLTATVQGAGFFVGKFTRERLDENQMAINGLRGGGKWIGQLERALIFILILIDQPMGIGFLVAAKSILRFEEARQQKIAEYVLIGTLLSFSLAIALAWATKWAMTLG